MAEASDSLLVRPRVQSHEAGIITRLTADEAGWKLLNVEARRMARDTTWSHDTGRHEMCIVVLGGRCAVRSNRGEWHAIGERPHVFAGMPYALYLPRGTTFALTALTEGLEVAYCWVPTDQDHSPHLVTPEESKIEIRGGNNATRQINSIIPSGFDCHRIICVEVYTPGGNWSSYPPHKHDVHREDGAGKILEADLEETYLYKFDKPGAYALQRIYTDDRSLDVALTAHDNDLVKIPRGYHPVSAAYGFDCYYLNFLAGSTQALAQADDPAYAWIKSTWTVTDPRVPLVRHAQSVGAAR